MIRKVLMIAIMFGGVPNVAIRIAYLRTIYMRTRMIIAITVDGGTHMTREELKNAIDKLMQQYANGEIDGATYSQRMMELTASAQSEIDDE